MISLAQKNNTFFETDYDIIILAGQSNCMGYAKGVQTFEEDIRNRVMYRDAGGGQGKPRRDKNRFYLHNTCPRAVESDNYTGFYMYFGQLYIQELLKEGRKLLFLRSAVGGTGFKDKHWGLKDDLYKDSISTAKKLLSGNPNNKIVGVLWHQGESDVYKKVSSAYYQEKLTDLIEGYRKELHIEDVPFIAGDFVPQWAESQPHSKIIKDATLKVLSKHKKCGFAESKGLCGNNTTDDMIHFNDASCVELGRRYYEEYKKVLAQR